MNPPHVHGPHIALLRESPRDVWPVSVTVCNPVLKDYTKGKKCLRVRDVAMSSLQSVLFFFLYPPPLPELTPPSRLPLAQIPTEGACAL